MDALPLLLSAVVVAIPAYLLLRTRYTELRAAPLWGAAWAMLALTGGLDAIANGRVWLQVLTETASLLAEGLMLAGALSFTRDRRFRSLPAWLWLGAPAIGLVHLADHRIGELAGALGGSALLAASSVVVWRYARRTRASAVEHAVSVAFVAMILIELPDRTIESLVRAKPDMLAAWMVLGFGTAICQLLSFVERVYRRQREMSQERDLLRRVASISRVGTDRARMLADLAVALGGVRPEPLISLWKRDGKSFQLLPSERFPPMPAALRRSPLDSPLAARVIASHGPIRLNPLEEEPLLAPVVRGSEIEWGMAAPIRVDGELVGALGVVFWPSPTPKEELEAFIEELVEAIVLVLRAAQTRKDSELQGRSLEVGRSETEALLEAVPVGILLTDSSSRVQLMNQTVVDQFDLGSPDSWVGRQVQDVMMAIRSRLDPKVQPELDAHMARLSRSRLLPQQVFELRFPEDDGRVLWMSAESVRQADGTHLGRVWVTHDVTAERRIAERMQHADRMETLGTLAGGLAHDFNNQLTGILGNARLLLQGLPADDPARAPLQDLERSAEHCAALTQGLLAFASQGPRAEGSVDLQALFAEQEALLRPSLAPGAALVIEIGPDTPPAAADPTELRRVLTNLLLNAADAIDSGGRIVLSARGIDGGQALELSVTDDGVGMDAKTRRRIFDPFFTTKRKVHGTGLGLAVAYGIVEAHGGSIEVTSHPGAGSCFRLFWPAATESAAAVEQRDAARASFESTGEGTILLAEDEPSVRRMARVALEGAGYRVLEAENGDDAVTRFDAQPGDIDLLLFDLSMPGLDGLSAVEAIRTRAPGLPALVMSGHPDRDRVWPADVPLLSKPFGPTLLLEQVGKLLAGRS
ncbi:MAG: response regulator [Deltaproteobacteria bacterium]|nr:response regulator [Deltaproteobacteria bacterium]MBW2395370.1 response regulator [Deltaproteobacteria bacterium]